MPEAVAGERIAPPPGPTAVAHSLAARELVVRTDLTTAAGVSLRDGLRSAWREAPAAAGMAGVA